MDNHHYEKTPLNPNLIKIYPDAITLNDEQWEFWNVTALAREANTGNSVSTGNNILNTDDTKETDIK
ncbi:MAG: hypothetical protein AAGC93_14145 [Cyanobacteria bacterium P01_F01_bin.53]